LYGMCATARRKLCTPFPRWLHAVWGVCGKAWQAGSQRKGGVRGWVQLRRVQQRNHNTRQGCGSARSLWGCSRQWCSGAVVHCGSGALWQRWLWQWCSVAANCSGALWQTAVVLCGSKLQWCSVAASCSGALGQQTAVVLCGSKLQWCSGAANCESYLHPLGWCASCGMACAFSVLFEDIGATFLPLFLLPPF